MYEASDHRPTQAIVNLKAIQHNVEWMVKQLAPDQRLYAVIKANAYGHGALPVASAALTAGAQGLAVATVDEAIDLRQSGLVQVPILVMGLTDPHGIVELLHYNITVTVSDSVFLQKAYEQLEATDQLQLLSLYSLPIHLAIDTGMGRIGLRTKDDIRAFAETMAGLEWVDWQGVFTHFATAGGGEPEYIDYQWEQWQEMLSVVPATVKDRHFANSAMGLWHNQRTVPHSTIVRFGIAMYGIDPKDQMVSDFEEAPESVAALQPAMELISEIIYVKEVPKGTRISYGATYETSGDEWIATIPIGYADGWRRNYQEVSLLVDGQECPVVGVINMDQLMIKLPKFYPVGTTVTLIGQDGGRENHVSAIARKADTIGYEIVTGIGPRVPRVYLND